MAGVQRKIHGVPPAPPNRCGLCQLTHHEEIEYFMDTGIWAEHEGVIYLCSRCFESLVGVSEEFTNNKDVLEVLAERDKETKENYLELETLRSQASKLHSLFGLRLADLDKFTELSNQLENLQGAVSTAKIKAERVEVEAQQLNTDQINAKINLAQINEQIEKAKAELDIFVSESLARKLQHIGREDLVDIILNNRLPEGITRPSDEDEREADGDNREKISASDFLLNY